VATTETVPPAIVNPDTGAKTGVGSATAETRNADTRYVAIGYVFAILGIVTFSSKSIFIKLAYAEGIGAEALLALRMILALPFYLGIGALSLRDRRRAGTGLPSPVLFVKAVLIGVLGYWVASYLDFLSLQRITAQYNVLILLTYPLFVVLFGALFFRQPVQRRAVIAFALAYVGVAVIFTGKLATLGSDIITGTGLVLAASVAFAFYMLFARDVIGQMGPRLFTCVTMIAMSTAAIVQFLLVAPVSALHTTPTGYGTVLLLAIIATVLPTFLMNAALQRITAQANATVGMAAPVMTIVMAAVVLGETMTVRDMLGAALVIGSVGWFTIGGRR